MSAHILVDQRAGSRELTRYIVPQQRVRPVAQLPTDIVFTGRGERGSLLEIGVEYKTIWDTLSCINSGRFAEQLQDLRQFDYSFLLIEGIIREASDARGCRLEVYGSPLGKPRDWYDTSEWGRGNRVWGYADFEHWYVSMILRGGVIVLPFTASKQDSGRRVGSLWRAFNDKAWEEHRAHLAVSKAHIAALRGDLPFFVRAISEADKLGPEGVRAAERRFGSMHTAANASVDDWSGLVVGGGVGKGGKRKKAHKLGRKSAQRIYDQIREDTRR